MITILIMFCSGLISFLFGNIFYQIKLKPFNDHKITEMALNIASFSRDNTHLNPATIFQRVGKLGFQMVRIDDKGRRLYYGKPFLHDNLSDGSIDNVLKGNIYHGVKNFPEKAFVTGFFDDESRNTVGVPINVNGKKEALFLRPDIEYQFGEMRIFFAVLVLLMIVISIVLVLFGAYYIVKPIRSLTAATKKIAHGDYHIQLNEQRKDELGQLARHFKSMTKSLERLEEMRQEFVSNVSHEIQSPLASIKGFSKTLHESRLSPLQQRKYLEIIEQETSRLSRLVKQLLTLTLLENQVNPLELTKFDLAQQIKEVVFMLEWQWRDKDLTLELELPSTMIFADAKLLHQVWINLLTNSVKFTKPGGTISVQIRQIGKKQLQVRFQDTGIGIAKEDLPHIFERFYKVDQARKRSQSGSGLGLSITKKILSLHNGSIEVFSEQGDGTTFIVSLPQM